MAHDARNFGTVIADAGEGLGRALMTLNTMMEGRVERATTLARQGRLDQRAAQRLINDGVRLEREAENTEYTKRQDAQKRARQVASDRQAQADRFREHREAGYRISPDLDYTAPAMSLAGAPTDMGGGVSFAGELTRIGSPREVRAQRDSTSTAVYQDREAQLKQRGRFEAERADRMVDLGFTPSGGRLAGGRLAGATDDDRTEDFVKRGEDIIGGLSTYTSDEQVDAALRRTLGVGLEAFRSRQSEFYGMVPGLGGSREVQADPWMVDAIRANRGETVTTLAQTPEPGGIGGILESVGLGGKDELSAAETKQQITADQADYLRSTGMTDEDIAARYIVR